jgi:LCP family protein required for cell wall assembly
MPDVPKRSRLFGPLARVLIGISAVLALIIAAGGTYSFARYRTVESQGTDCTFSGSCNGSSRAPGVGGKCVNDVCNYLLLGSDSREGLSASQLEQFGTNAQSGAGKNADTIMLVHTDPKLGKAIILSFPRDLWVNIPGHGYGKINSSFQGGAKLVAATIHQLTGLEVNHYLYVNLAGFEGVVNTLGGVLMCIPAENVNTPGYVDSSNAHGSTTPVYYGEVGHIVDPNTGLDVKPGCQRLNGTQSLAYVRTRHLRCDAVPDFSRISRQQQFLRAVLNRLLQPQELAQAPSLIGPILSNMVRDSKLNPAELAFLVGQLRGITTGAAEFRAVPGTEYIVDGQTALKMDPSAEQMFKAVRDGRQIGDLGSALISTPPSPANIKVTVIDHSSAAPAGQQAAGVEQVLSNSGFDVSPGIVSYSASGSQIPGSWIAYSPGNSVEALVVQQYFPNLQVKEVKGLKGVAIFVSASYEPVKIGAGSGAPPDCVKPAG